MIVMMIRVKMEHFISGKRANNRYEKDYQISDEFWNGLLEKVEEDEFSMVFKSDTNKIETLRSFEMDSWFKENCIRYDEPKLYDDIKHEHINGFILIERIFVANWFEKKCVDIRGNYAYFIGKKNNLFNAMISDSVKDSIKVGSKCRISVLANQKWIVTGVEDE